MSYAGSCAGSCARVLCGSKWAPKHPRLVRVLCAVLGRVLGGLMRPLRRPVPSGSSRGLVRRPYAQRLVRRPYAPKTK